jgi:glycosyltransferase involved in cell wall biosynthesis
MKKILFISHEASRSGAPIVLLQFLKWIKKHHPEFLIGVLIIKSGVLERDFKAVSDKLYFIKSSTNKTLFSRLISKLRFKNTNHTKLLKSINKEDYNIIYANSVVSLDIAVKIKLAAKQKPKLIAHIHELYIGLRKYVPEPTAVVPYIDHIIGASNQVVKNIQNSWNINDNKISRVYEFSAVDDMLISKENSSRPFLVGASGTVFWRKGYDFFIQVARYIFDNYENLEIEFNWIGNISKNETLIIEEDLQKLELTNKVKFLGEFENPSHKFNEFDVFLMTSKEDPFPLVCIEVGMLGKPIICFDKATGIQEVMKDGGGVIVPYLNIEVMAEAVVKYYRNKVLYEKDSNIAKDIFRRFSPENMCPEIYAVLQNLLDE